MINFLIGNLSVIVPDFVDPDEVFGRCELQVFPLLLHLVRDLARGQLRAVEAWKI